MATKVKLLLVWSDKDVQTVEWDNYPEFFNYPKRVADRKVTTPGAATQWTSTTFKRVGDTNRYEKVQQ